MVARIFRPSKSAMQSGTGQTKSWMMELDYNFAKTIDPLMGWTGSKDTNSQVQIKFKSEQAAINFAKSLFLMQKTYYWLNKKVCQSKVLLHHKDL